MCVISAPVLLIQLRDTYAGCPQNIFIVSEFYIFVITIYNCLKQNDNIHLEFALVTFHKHTSYNVADAEMTFFLGPGIFRIPGVLVLIALTILFLNFLPLLHI